jgi:hypothetical protein
MASIEPAKRQGGMKGDRNRPHAAMPASHGVVRCGAVRSACSWVKLWGACIRARGHNHPVQAAARERRNRAAPSEPAQHGRLDGTADHLPEVGLGRVWPERAGVAWHVCSSCVSMLPAQGRGGRSPNRWATRVSASWCGGMHARRTGLEGHGHVTVLWCLVLLGSSTCLLRYGDSFCHQVLVHFSPVNWWNARLGRPCFFWNYTF